MAEENSGGLLGNYQVDPNTGDVTSVAAGTNASGGGNVSNDVWGTLKAGFNSLGGTVINAVRDVAVAKTRSTPSGATQGTINPFPGTQSAFPQSDPKVLQASVPGLGGMAISLPIIGVVLVLLVLALRGR